jgi:hypothetical protein
LVRWPCQLQSSEYPGLAAGASRLLLCLYGLRVALFPVPLPLDRWRETPTRPQAMNNLPSQDPADSQVFARKDAGRTGFVATFRWSIARRRSSAYERNSSDGWSSGFLKSPVSSLPVGPTLYLGPESRFSGGFAQFGRICAMEREIKAGLRRRSSRRVNMMARRNPARAPRTPSVIERLLKVRRPWPVRRNPVYAITTVQTIARTFTGSHTPAGFPRLYALCLPRHTYITSALLAMEIQGTPYLGFTR